MSYKKHVFTFIEKKVFLDIIKGHEAIIDNKNIDSATMRKKDAAWQYIAREYNANPHVKTKVSAQQLKRLRQNMRTRQRTRYRANASALTKNQQNHMANGADPSTIGAETDLDGAEVAAQFTVEDPNESESIMQDHDYEDLSDMITPKKLVFSPLEKRVFLDILRGYSTIINDTNIDNATLHRKDVAWQYITREYNENPQVKNKVSMKQLKRLRQNMKQRHRKRQRDAFIKKHQHYMANGEEPSTSSAEIDPDGLVELELENPGSNESDPIIQDNDEDDESKMNYKKHIFTSIEKKVLLDILKKHSDIIDVKNTDGATLHKKDVAWEHITREYNASPHVTTKVTMKQLKSLRINMRKRQREVIKKRQHHMANGDEPLSVSAEIDCDGAEMAPEVMIEVPSESEYVIQDPENVSNKIEDLLVGRLKRAKELHALEEELLLHKIREAKAKADLAELLLLREQEAEQQRRPSTSMD